MSLILGSILSMDIFQLLADMLHLIAVIILIIKILGTRNVIGLSYRTQEIYLIVFLTRYIDLFISWKTFYLFFMKIFFILLTLYTVYLIRVRKPIALTYDKESDTFPHYFLYLAAAVLTMIIHKSWFPMAMLWSYSVWLEALAILPQLFMIQKIKDIENITAHYVLFLSLYRAFYILHWFWNWKTVVWTSFLAGGVQTALYTDFIFYFFKAKDKQRIMQFPV